MSAAAEGGSRSDAGASAPRPVDPAHGVVHLPKSAEILAKYTKIDIATIAVMERARFAETLTAASIQPAIDVTAKYGKFEPFPADRLIYHAN